MSILFPLDTFHLLANEACICSDGPSAQHPVPLGEALRTSRKDMLWVCSALTKHFSVRCSKDSEKKTLQIFSKTERMCPVEGIHTHTKKRGEKFKDNILERRCGGVTMIAEHGVLIGREWGKPRWSWTNKNWQNTPKLQCKIEGKRKYLGVQCSVENKRQKNSSGWKGKYM